MRAGTARTRLCLWRRSSCRGLRPGTTPRALHRSTAKSVRRPPQKHTLTRHRPHVPPPRVAALRRQPPHRCSGPTVRACLRARVLQLLTSSVNSSPPVPARAAPKSILRAAAPAEPQFIPLSDQGGGREDDTSPFLTPPSSPGTCALRCHCAPFIHVMNAVLTPVGSRPASAAEAAPVQSQVAHRGIHCRCDGSR